jgi:hypothetical protein
LSQELVRRVDVGLTAEAVCAVQPMTRPASPIFYYGEDDMRNVVHVTVTVKVADLLEILKENLETHKEEFEEAFAGYEAACIKKLRKRASQIAQNRTKQKASNWMDFNMAVPKSYASCYEQLIQMFEMATEEEIKVSGDQFRQWVQDDWDWKKQHAMTKHLYSSS